MKLKVIATGSKGNCYLLSTDTETLIIDCGVNVAEIKKGLKYALDSVVGCIVTHEHKDHALSVDKLRNMGIEVYTPYDRPNDDLQIKYLGNFGVMAFQVPHDGTVNYGFMIKVDEKKILYLTDMEYSPLKFIKQKVHAILVECNYQMDMVDKWAPNYEHKLKGHCALETCVDFVKTNASERLGSVLLLHMGEDSCNPMQCVAEVQKVAKTANVDYARQGLEIEL